MIVETGRKFLLSELAGMCEARLVGEDKIIESISTDSREIGRNTLFAAMKGEKSDGNDYIANAFANGASAAICEKIPDGCEKSLLVTNNSFDSLTKAAKKYTIKIDPLKIAVTGSVGKTTTKELIYSVLQKSKKTHKSESNYNTNVGLVMTLLAMKEDTQALVCEMGMSAFGEISEMSHILNPNIGVITNIGTSHLEYLKTRENIAKAKCEILDGMQNGILLYNGDETLLRGKKGEFGSSLSFGMQSGINDVFPQNIRSQNGGTYFDIVFEYVRDRAGGIYIDGFKNEKTQAYIPITGNHNVCDSLAAYIVGKIAGMDEKQILEGLADYKTVGLRQNIYKKNGITIIADCYNASPESMRAALENLSNISITGKRAAFLGDMRELGQESAELHYEIGRESAQNNIELLFTYGQSAYEIARGARENGVRHIYSFGVDAPPEEMAECVKLHCSEGDALLFKASHSMSLERIINLL